MTATMDRLDEEVTTEAVDTFTGLLGRLNDQSVRPGKHFDAYVDVPWDEHPIEPTDPRWELHALDGLGATAWYQAQPQDVRARMGLHGIASKMQIGYFFEGVLKRGLLEHATTLPAGSPELRYVYHEVIEEAQHSLMFQEFVNRSGLEAPGLTWDMKFGARRVIGMARRFPAMFFVFVLGGEDPIDHVQRTALRSGREIHPLLERIMRIHVTEEARHLSFARQYLRHTVPTLSRVQRRAITIQAPMTLATMAGVMMRPPRQLVRTYDIPKATLTEAYRREGPAGDAVRESLRKVRDLLVDLELVTPMSKQLWRRLGIWDEATA
jgi:hypothetical protein